MSKQSQLDKFKAAAKEAECKMGADKFDKALKEIAQPKAIVHVSDCAIHNAPATEPEPCDCGAEARK